MDLSHLARTDTTRGSDGQLAKDALKLASDKSLYDIRTVLMWAEQSTRLDEKLMHITHALELLAEVKDNLEAMQ